MHVSQKHYCNQVNHCQSFPITMVRASNSSGCSSVTPIGIAYRRASEPITQQRALFLWKHAIHDPNTQVKMLLFYLSQCVGQSGIANTGWKLKCFFKLVDFFFFILPFHSSQRAQRRTLYSKVSVFRWRLLLGQGQPRGRRKSFSSVVHLLFLLLLETLQGEPCWDLQTKSLSEWGSPRRTSGSSSCNRCSSWRCAKKSETYSYSHKVPWGCLVGGCEGRQEERNPYHHGRGEPGETGLFCFGVLEGFFFFGRISFI